jgi:hypothetical protein
MEPLGDKARHLIVRLRSIANVPHIRDLRRHFIDPHRTSTVELRLDPSLYGRNQRRLEVGLQGDLLGRLVGEPAHPSVAAGHIGPSQFEGYRGIGRSVRDTRQCRLLLPPTQPSETLGAEIRTEIATALSNLSEAFDVGRRISTIKAFSKHR